MALKVGGKRAIVPADKNKLRFVKQTWFKLIPQKGITMDEIASILGLLQISIDKSVYDGLRDPKVVRHFQRIDG